MDYAKLIIPKMSDKYKLHVYRSTSADDINTIEKIKNRIPVFVIDESSAPTEDVDGKKCYILYDKSEPDTVTGITYNGPAPNTVPSVEYETTVSVSKINDYTYVNVLNLIPLPLKISGIMFYYSVIGVDESTGFITHLSKPNGILVTCPYEKEGNRHIYSCNDYTGDDATDIWEYVSFCDWEHDISIGDVNNTLVYSKFGCPFVETVRSLDKDKINVSIKPVIVNGYMVAEIQNPWMRNNREFNFRKLKSYKIQNVVGEQYSEFSEPTFQSILPVSIEKMLILRKDDPDDLDTDISLSEYDADDVTRYEIIRKDGIFYNRKEHKRLGLNKYNIPIEEKIGVFSESSVQDKIKIQMEARSAHKYRLTIYLIDVYNHISEPVSITITT